jgi:signal transduction histidine kinase
MATILVVDDRAVNRQFLGTLLGYAGHRVIEAADGVEALDAARAGLPGLIISDILMPNMDGIRLAKELRADPATARIPVMFYTATYRVSEARGLAESCGVKVVLAKPSEPAAILEAVASFVGTESPPPQAILLPAVDYPQPGLVIDRLADYLQSLQQLNEHINKAVDRGLNVVGRGGELRQVSYELANSFAQVQTVSLRLSALVELGLELASHRDPEHMVQTFCRAMQDILSARQVAVGLLEDPGAALRHFAARGMDARDLAGLNKLLPANGILAEALSERRPLQRPGEADTPGSGAPVLAVPVISQQRALGWIYLAGKLGGGIFGAADEEFAATLAIQLALAYENLILRTQLERRVDERTVELQTANRELESFSYSVSHDLRAPLRAINGYVGILQRDHGAQLAPEARKLCDGVTQSATRMGALIDDLLAFSRLGRRALSTQRVDLAHLARECVAELAPEREGRRVDVVIEDTPPCHGDAIVLKQALFNLLSNAHKYTRKCESARIGVGGEKRGGECVFHVRDNGVGFDMAYSDRLFQVFQRLHSQSEFEGTGVGLALVKRVVDKHGGRVWAESTPGQGATFYFSLPAPGSTATNAPPDSGIPPST